MLNLLIANKNPQNLQDLLNYISQYIPEVRVSYLAKTGIEFIEAIKKYRFDIILMDYNLSSNTGIDIINNFSEDNQRLYNNSIIFLCKDKNMIEYIQDKKVVFEAILNTESFTYIISSLRKLVEIKEDKTNPTYIKNKVIEELQNIGFNLAHNGTKYLLESILLIAIEKYDRENLHKNVYPKICKKYNKSMNNVKTNITMATATAYNTVEPATLRKYLKIPENIKPTPKMIINCILKKLGQ